MILLFLVPPGPDMAVVAAAGLTGGRRAAVQANAGVGAGLGVYERFSTSPAAGAALHRIAAAADVVVAEVVAGPTQ